MSAKGRFRRPIRDWVTRWTHTALAWIGKLFGYDLDSEVTCDFCGTVQDPDNFIRHMYSFHPAEAKALEPEWRKAGIIE